MITFVTGKPGDGKTMYGMKLMVDTLINTDRVICTNVAVNVSELRAYAIRMGWKPKPGNDIADRFIALSHDDTFEFYRQRSGMYTLPPSPDWVVAREGEDSEGKKLKKPSRFALLRQMTAQMQEMKKVKRALRPMEYHIDEAHDYFSAREWADTGRGILWYASKHRHLHDEIIFYTQVMGNVESQLRGLASVTVRVRNQIRMSWGPFRKAPIFRLYHYYGAPEELEKAVPYNTSVMQLDVNGLCKTYNSTGALSVHTKPEEVRNKAPLPYWALPLSICAAGLLVVLFVAGLPYLAGKWAGKSIEQKAKATAATLAPTLLSHETFKAKEAPPPAEKPTELGVPVRGVMMLGNVMLVKVENEDWARVAKDLGDGYIELATGTIVKRKHIENVPRAKPPPMPTRPTDITGAQ